MNHQKDVSLPQSVARKLWELDDSYEADSFTGVVEHRLFHDLDLNVKSAIIWMDDAGFIGHRFYKTRREAETAWQKLKNGEQI